MDNKKSGKIGKNQLERMAKLVELFINKDVLFVMIMHDDKVCVSCNDVDKWLAIDEINLEKP